MSSAPPNPFTGTNDGDAWRQRLLASLRDCGVQRPTGSWGLFWFLNSALAIVIMIILRLVQWAFDAGRKNSIEPEFLAIAGLLWFLFVVFVLARVRNRALRKAWSNAARTAEQELERAGSRRPILYLRSFQLDERVGRPAWYERFLGFVPLATVEQVVTKLLRKQGPVIAIGRPDEQLPPLGAARFYVSHDRWKEKVAEIAKESKYVIWATGVTEGLRWEISHLVDSVPPEKIILWAHPHLLGLGEAEREAEWTKFRDTLGKAFPKPLPERLGAARFIYFSSDWTPRPVAPPKRIWPWFSADRAALKAVLNVKQGKWKEADVVYDGPRTDDDFEGLIGAVGNPIHWQRAAAFAIAIYLKEAGPRFVDSRFYGYGFHYTDFTGSAMGAVFFAVAVIVAFKYIRNEVGAVAAAAAAAVFLSNLGNAPVGDDHEMSGEYHRYLTQFVGMARHCIYDMAFIGGLVWATRRISPRVLALWVGAMFPLALEWFFALLSQGASPRDFNHEYPDSPYHTIRPFLPPIFFAVSFAIGIRMTPTPRA